MRAVVDERDGYGYGYGYDVVRRLRDAGLEQVGDASVYGTLRRLYAAGALSSYVVPSEEGPHREYYGIDDVGRGLLQSQTKAAGGTDDRARAAAGDRAAAAGPGNADAGAHGAADAHSRAQCPVAPSPVPTGPPTPPVLPSAAATTPAPLAPVPPG